jgi:mannonate dehydratase
MMRLCLRWYGADDPVPLEYIRQVPGVEGVVSALFDIPVGRVWPLERIRNLRNRVERAGLKLLGIESVPVHEDIKLGLSSRDKYLKAYAQTIRNLGAEGIPIVCYNFLPVFDWVRTDLAMRLPDGSSCLSYDREAAVKIDPLSLADLDLPAWVGDFSPARIQELFKLYAERDEEDLWNNLKYFLEYIIPAAEQSGVVLGMHPDDPPWPIFGLPRIASNQEDLQRLLDLVDSPANGLSLCSGALGASPDNDIPAMIHDFGGQGRIHFAHVRNVLIKGEQCFRETAHPSSEGGLNMYEIIKAYHDVGFDGIMRPDHGRMIFGETGNPGYGLYDRALGAAYLLGLWEAVSQPDRQAG